MSQHSIFFNPSKEENFKIKAKCFHAFLTPLCVYVIFSTSRQDNNVDSTSCLKETEKPDDPKQGN